MIAPAFVVVTEALRVAADEARSDQRPEDQDRYLQVLDQLQAGDLELVPKRGQVAMR